MQSNAENIFEILRKILESLDSYVFVLRTVKFISFLATAFAHSGSQLLTFDQLKS